MIRSLVIFLIFIGNICSQGTSGIDSLSVISDSWCQDLPRTIYSDLERVRVSDDWFQVYKLENNVFAIYEPLQWQEVISYLILGTKKALLFDTGNGIGKISTVVNELTSLPVIVLNSHTHFDHIGGNAEFKTVLAMDTDYTRKNIGGYSNDLVWEEVSEEALCGALPDRINPIEYHTPPFKVQKFIKGGYKIDLGGRVLEVLSTPGHTPDAISIFDPEMGLLWVGDIYYGGPIWLFAPETDMDAYYQSVKRLCNIVHRLNVLHPGHNGPVAEPYSLCILMKALINIQSGTVNGNSISAGRTEYIFEGFSLIVK